VIVLLIEVVSVLLFIAFAGSQIILPWVNEQPLFPDLRPKIRRQLRAEAALRAAEEELAKLRKYDN
jgi:hypothetical protein